MLDRYPGFETHDAELARAATFEKFRGTYFDASTQVPFFVKANWVETDRFRLTSVHTGASSEVGYEPETVLRQYFAIEAESGLDFTVGRSVLHLSQASAPVIVPAHTPFRISARRQHVLALRIEADTLKAQIAALLGEHGVESLDFSSQLARHGSKRQLMKQAVLQFIADLELMGSAASPAVLEGLGQGLMLKFLFYNEHSLSAKLWREPPTPSLTQVKRTEEFIEANWDKVLKIEDIAKELSTSARSIFRHFKNLRGTSPLGFQKSIRLARARAMLQLSESEVSVTSIAVDCGFASLGHFAREYRAKFGELPSETLRHSRSSRQLRHGPH